MTFDRAGIFARTRRRFRRLLVVAGATRCCTIVPSHNFDAIGPYAPACAFHPATRFIAVRWINAANRNRSLTPSEFPAAIEALRKFTAIPSTHKSFYSAFYIYYPSVKFWILNNSVPWRCKTPVSTLVLWFASIFCLLETVECKVEMQYKTLLIYDKFSLCRKHCVIKVSTFWIKLSRDELFFKIIKYSIQWSWKQVKNDVRPERNPMHNYWIF